MDEVSDFFSSYVYYDVESFINRELNDYDSVDVLLPDGHRYPGRVEYDNSSGFPEGYVVSCNDERYEPNYSYDHNFGSLFPTLMDLVDSVKENREDFVSAAKILTSVSLPPTIHEDRAPQSRIVAKVEHALIDRGLITADTILRNPTSGTIHRCENKKILPGVVFTAAYLSSEPGTRARAAAVASGLSFVTKVKDVPSDYDHRQVYLGFSATLLSSYRDALALEWNVFDPGVIQTVLISVQEENDRIHYNYRGYTSRRGCYRRSPGYLRYRSSDICESFPVGFSCPLFVASTAPLNFPPPRVEIPLGVLPLKLHVREKRTVHNDDWGRCVCDASGQIIFPLELGDPVSARSWMLVNGIAPVSPALYRDDDPYAPDRGYDLLFPFATRLVNMSSQLLRPLSLPVMGRYDGINLPVIPPHLRPPRPMPDGSYYSITLDYFCYGPTHSSVSRYYPYGSAKLIGTPPAMSWTWKNTIKEKNVPLLFPPSYVWYCERILSTAPTILGYADCPIDVDQSGFVPFEI